MPGRHGPSSLDVRSTGAVLTVTRYRGLVTLLKGRVVMTHPAGYVKLTPSRSKRLTAAAVPVATPARRRATAAETPRSQRTLLTVLGVS